MSIPVLLGVSVNKKRILKAKTTGLWKNHYSY
jgi:hypothetical protein